MARRTNEVFLDDDIWFSKFREILGNQDRHNLTYYQDAHGFINIEVESLEQLVDQFRGSLNGCVVWDTNFPDTVNAAIMLAAQEELLVVDAALLTLAKSHGLQVVHDLRERWKNRLDLTQWTYEKMLTNVNPDRLPVLNRVGSALNSSTMSFGKKFLPTTYPANTKVLPKTCFCCWLLVRPGCAS